MLISDHNFDKVAPFCDILLNTQLPVAAIPMP